MSYNHINEARLTSQERNHLYGKTIGYTFVHRGEIMTMTQADPLCLEWEAPISKGERLKIDAAAINEILSRVATGLPYDTHRS